VKAAPLPSCLEHGAAAVAAKGTGEEEGAVAVSLTTLHARLLAGSMSGRKTLCVSCVRAQLGCGGEHMESCAVACEGCRFSSPILSLPLPISSAHKSKKMSLSAALLLAARRAAPALCSSSAASAARVVVGGGRQQWRAFAEDPQAVPSSALKGGAAPPALRSASSAPAGRTSVIAVDDWVAAKDASGGAYWWNRPNGEPRGGGEPGLPISACFALPRTGRGMGRAAKHAMPSPPAPAS